MASYEVLTDFSNPDTTKYLNVKKGDRITKINEPEPGWSMCFIEGRNGYVPTSYIKPVTDTTPLSQIPQPLPKRSIVAPPTMGWMQEDQYHKYKMIRKLFGGAQGKTFLVERKETNKLFVLKKVDYLDADDIQKANREVEQMFNLASPFTVLLVCVFPHDDVELCLVMEYCEKGDLRKVMAQLQQLPEEERLMRVWEILAQIFLAVDHLHSHDVIHRDIKPENIFVMADGSVRVGDFGLAKNVENRDYATAVGTKVYQAPEVFEQQKMTAESDVFAVGEVIFELLSGRHPFESRTEQGMIENICKGEIAPFPAYTEGSMKQIVLAMMNHNPSRRPSAKEVLSHDVVRMYLRLYQGRQNVDESGRMQILLQEKDREKQRANFAVQRILQIEQERDNEKRRVDEYKARADQSNQRIQVLEGEKQDQIRRAEAAEDEITRLRLQLAQKDQEIQDLTIRPQPRTEPEAIFPDQVTAQQQGNVIIHALDNYDNSTVAYNPIVTNGIVRFEGAFQKYKIGIADSSVVFGSKKDPSDNEYDGKTVCYQNNGHLVHINKNEIAGNALIEDRQTIALEVNMTSSPRTLTFFINGQQQPLSVCNIPPSIRFWINLCIQNQTFTLTRFERINSPSTTGIQNSKVMQWGQIWISDDEKATVETNKLFVGRINPQTTSADLGKLFGEVGQVESANVATTNEGISRRFGYVTMNSVEAAQRAIQVLNGRTLNGHNIVVRFYRDISPPPAPIQRNWRGKGTKRF